MTKIAVIGAGINGILIALNLARKGINIDLYEKSSIPNLEGLSWDHMRLWRHIHEHNPIIQDYAQKSRKYWEDLICEKPNLGKKTESLRIAKKSDFTSLIDLYKKNNENYEIKHIDIPYINNTKLKNKTFFISHDAIILNASEIYLHLFNKVKENKNINVYYNHNWIIEEKYVTKNLDINGGEYYAIIISANTPFSEKEHIKKHQIHFDIKIKGEHQLFPILALSDSLGFWCVPSIDNKILKVSSRNFSFTEKPNIQTIRNCAISILKYLNIDWHNISQKISTYHEQPYIQRAHNGKYWSNKINQKLICIESCDASIFKIAPSLSKEICNEVLRDLL